VNQLVVPAGVPIHFALTSASVMNAFFIPQLGSMIYTMNGMTTQLNLQADSPGTFRGLSSHYSGDGFSRNLRCPGTAEHKCPCLHLAAEPDRNSPSPNARGFLRAATRMIPGLRDALKERS
jgi:Cytochrome C oxidase subunit II, periplasmic domain